jgi:hypothetical protein
MSENREATKSPAPRDDPPIEYLDITDALSPIRHFHGRALLPDLIELFRWKGRHDVVRRSRWHAERKAGQDRPSVAAL